MPSTEATDSQEAGEAFMSTKASGVNLNLPAASALIIASLV